MFAVGGGYLLGIGLGWGIVGMWLAMCVDEWLRAGFLLITFARGGWRRRALAMREASAAEKPKEPNVQSVPVLMALAADDDGALADGVVDAVSEVARQLW